MVILLNKQHSVVATSCDQHLYIFQSGVFLTERGQNIKKSTNVVYISIDIGETWLELHDFVDVSVFV